MNIEDAADLIRECREFIDAMSITCPEAIHQTDRVAEHALFFIEAVCELVGYAKPEKP